MALALSGCNERDRDGAFRSGGNPGDGTCRRSALLPKSGEAVSSDNSFDRTSFLSGDQIKVTRTKKASGTAAPQSASYRYDGTSAWTVVEPRL